MVVKSSHLTRSLAGYAGRIGQSEFSVRSRLTSIGNLCRAFKIALDFHLAWSLIKFQRR